MANQECDHARSVVAEILGLIRGKEECDHARRGGSTIARRPSPALFQPSVHTSAAATSHTTRCTKLSIPAVLRPCSAWQLTLAVKKRERGGAILPKEPDPTANLGNPVWPWAASAREISIVISMFSPAPPPGAHAQGSDASVTPHNASVTFHG